MALINPDPSDIVETWDTYFPPKKMIMVTPEGEAGCWRALCRATVGDNFTWRYMRFLSLPAEYGALRISFYDLYLYPRFVHSLDVGHCVILPTMPRR